MTAAFLDYFRCPEEFARFGVAQELGQTPGFFHFGNKITCFGRSAGPVAQLSHGDLSDSLSLMQIRPEEITLPFDADEILENLRKERYVPTEHAPSFAKKLIRKGYYAARPFLPVGIRKHLQQFHLRERRKTVFPSWPLDKTVDNLCAELMSASVRVNGNRRIPFVWFWPDEYQGCAI